MRRGHHLLWAQQEGALSPKDENKEHACRRASGARGWRRLVLYPGVEDTARPRCADAPEAATLPTKSWRGGQELAVSILGTEEGFQKRRP